MVLVTASEAAEILGVRVQTVYNYASTGLLRRHAPSHVRRAFDHAEVETRSLRRLTRGRPKRHHYWAMSLAAAEEVAQAIDEVVMPVRSYPCAVAEMWTDRAFCKAGS